MGLYRVPEDDNEKRTTHVVLYSAVRGFVIIIIEKYYTTYGILFRFSGFSYESIAIRRSQ